MIIEDGVVLPGLIVPKLSFVADPEMADSVELEYGVVTVASPTHDADRLTIHVPAEATVLSLGAASAQWKTDFGIVGYTNNHIHFETKANDKTVVSLGGPATTSAIKGHDEAVPVASQGYSMVTAERAWHESNGQHYLLSQDEDISLLTLGPGKRAVVQADHGHVDINGGEEVNLSGGGVAIGAASGIQFEDVLYDGNFSGKAPTSTSAKTAKVGMDLISGVFSAHDLGLKAFKTATGPKIGALAKTEFFWADVVKWGTDAVKFGLSVNKLRKVFQHVASPPGCVKLAAESDVAGLAGTDVSFSGVTGASLASTLFTTVSAGLMASMKGTLFAGVGGILTSLKGQKKIEICSTSGDLVFGAKKNIEFTSDESFVAASAKDAQVTGKKHLLFGAGERAFIGVGKGWGVLFDKDGVALGKASGVDDLDSATIEPSPAIRIDSGKIDIVRESVGVTLTDDLLLIQAPGIRLDAKQKNVTFNGRQALLE